MTAGCQADDDSATTKRSASSSPFSHASGTYYVMTSSAGPALQTNGAVSEPAVSRRAKRFKVNKFLSTLPCVPQGPITLDLSAKADAPTDEHSPGAIKDDDDEDDDDVEDRIDTQGHDPERLKAFNVISQKFPALLAPLGLTKVFFSISNQMFVRLFVDENLDRMVPISRQPREKVQAIIGNGPFESD